MHTLFRFFQRHHVFFLFLILEGIAVTLLIRNNYIQRISFARATGIVSGTIYEQISEWSNYLHLREINRRLVEENAQLRNGSLHSFYRTDSVVRFVYDTAGLRKYVHVPAKVVNSTVNKQYNFLTLNKGEAHNISKDMAVTGPDGIVGIISGVSGHFATVLPVINRNFRISTKFKKNNFYGALTWNGRSYRHAELNEIPLHVPVEVGDTLVVTGFSSSFPEGSPVGTVSHFDKKDGNFYAIEVLLFTDFRNLHHVSVVHDLMKEEQENLEQKITDGL
ncbi:MAG: rod shape-determining protein MreC [Bacteroidales bacterium]|jgi:rod shape-determining protein MreC|nr:rod shape-determining protein MreC [Bacteroidales bacterium]